MQHALAAARRNTTIDRALPFIKPNDHFCLKPPAEMERLFREQPEAVANTLRIAELCRFNLSTDLGYTLPDPQVPAGHTSESYLRRLCEEAARRRYGALTERVRERLDEGSGSSAAPPGRLPPALPGDRAAGPPIMEERGLIHPDTPLEERPPGRGRGSSVALLVGYLIGISHVDPLRWNLTLERFMPEDMHTLPDIDLDFPRALRDELIARVHQHFGAEYAVLAGAIATYSLKGIIQDLGKALGLPREDLRLLSKQMRPRGGEGLREAMLDLPAFRDRVDAPGWRDLTELAPQLLHAPRGLGQHVGGMVLSDSPIPEMVPIRDGAIEGRFIMDWNKDSVADANFAKIDILSLPVLDQIEEALDLIEEREGARPDLSRIDPEDPNVYDLINEGRGKGVFLLQSPAQLKIAQRLLSRNLLDLAYQVALIRPRRRRAGERRLQVRRAPPARGRVDVRPPPGGARSGAWLRRHRLAGAGGPADHGRGRHDRRRGRRAAARLRPAPERAPDSPCTGSAFWKGRAAGACPRRPPARFFAKINGHYMFPESHSHAFAITAYQAAWLKRYHPLEFFVALVNNQSDGLLPPGDAQGGRPPLRRALPQSVREPQPGEGHSRQRLRAAGLACSS